MIQISKYALIICNSIILKIINIISANHYLLCLNLIFFIYIFFSEYVRKYATEEALREQEQQAVSSDSESSMSDFSEDEAQDMEL